jgi:hypothetical protein
MLFPRWIRFARFSISRARFSSVNMPYRPFG